MVDLRSEVACAALESLKQEVAKETPSLERVTALIKAINTISSIKFSLSAEREIIRINALEYNERSTKKTLVILGIAQVISAIALIFSFLK